MGLGYVGLPTACLLANTGLEVLGVDTDLKTVEALGSGETHLGEAGLDTLVSAAIKSGNLRAAAEPEQSGTFVICVPTPLTPDKHADLSAVESAARSILPALEPGNLVIVESTCPVGTTRGTVGRILAESGMEPGRGFDLCYCPERVLPGNTVGELVRNDRIVGGVTPESADRARELYARFCDGEIVVTDDLTAEMCKLMENTYRDVNIALANTFARIAERSGVDVWRAIEHANLHPRVDILRPGPGVGGHCIPIDPYFLVESFPAETSLLRSARDVNSGQPVRVLEGVARAAGLGPGDKLAVLGAAYKADIDDPRESPSFALAREAMSRGLIVAVHDPLVREGTHAGVLVKSDLSACVEGAKAALVMTAHEPYRQLRANDLKSMAGRSVYDSHNCLDADALRDGGFTVTTLGVGGATSSSDTEGRSP
jgi:UDP-N-acetyl-D-mannosaminuronic acid dehydrogenase